MNETAQLHCSFSADAAFGPVVEGCRDGFDFTMSFEQYFLSLVPSVLFLVAATFRLRFLRKQKSQVEGKLLRSIKLIAIGVFAILQLAIVVLWSTQTQPQIGKTTATASTFALVTSFVLCALSYFEHTRSIQPSVLLNVYLFFSVLFDAVILRTLWTSTFNRPVRDLSIVTFALKVVILFLEAKEKREYITSDCNHGPEQTSGLYNQTFLWWMNSIIRQGYQRLLKPADLFHIGDNMSSEVLNRNFWKMWNEVALTKRPKLVKVLVRLLKGPLLIPIIPRIALLSFTFCQPLLVSKLLHFLQDADKVSTNTGCGLIGAYALVYFGMSVSNSIFTHRNYKCLTILRGTLVTAIYCKTTELGISALDNSAAVTLMSTDVERLIRGLKGMHDLWSNIIQFALATWLLEAQLGWACIAPIIVTLVTSVITVILSFRTNKLQVRWISQVQKRVGITSNVLSRMKGIKMSGLTETLTSLVQGLRVNEIKFAEKFWLQGAITSALAWVPLMISPVATFAIYAAIAANKGTTLDTPQLFTSLALLVLLTQPLFYLYNDIIEFRSTFGCFERIEKFLISETRSDHRLPLGESRTHASGQHSTNSIPTDVAFAPIELMSLDPSGATLSKGHHPLTDVVRVECGSFGWNKDEIPVLHDIDLNIPSSRLTLLIGPIGSGKSTLLKGLLGETAISKGFVYVSDTEVGYCEQTPWLTNVSVKENIIGFSTFDQNLYDVVVHSCDLEQDITMFPQRDQTIVGSNGISLSSGQKQRIAIARAVYARNKLIILDDVFSGLDANTLQNIFNRLLGPQGLLRQWETTVLVATHAANLLPFSDHIIVLSKDGSIAEQGSFENLKVHNGYVGEIWSKHASIGITTSTNSESEEIRDPNHVSARYQAAPKTTNPDDKLRQLGDWNVYKYYFHTIGWGMTSIFLLLSVAWAFFSTFPTIWLKWYSDSNAIDGNKRTPYYLGVYTALQVVGLLDFCLLTWFSFTIMAKRSGLRLHERILGSVMSAPMSFFNVTDTGSIVTRFSQDIQLLDAQLPLSVMCVATNLFVCLAQMGLIASAAYYVATCFPVLAVVYYVIQRYYLRTSRQMRFLDLEEKAPVYTQFIESLSGLATIRAFCWQKASIEHNHVLVDRSQKPFYLMYMIQTWLTLVLDLITTALAILVVAVAVKMRDTVSIGFTGVSLTQIISLTANLKLWILFYTQMETSIGAVARVKRFTEETNHEDLLGETFIPPAEWPSRGHVRISNLCVNYKAGDLEMKALYNVSLNIEPGSKTAIVGRTGSGKSTLLNTIFRLTEIHSGRIEIDDFDISTLPRQHIRSRLNAISEDPYFLNGSVRLNLDPFKISSNDEMEKVLQKFQLWDLIRAKGGLNADFSNETLSHGQKQLFCLARATLRPCQVIVMDEVTSSVDLNTDALMQRLIREEFEGKTVLTITHRVDTIMDYDNVAVLKDGELVEFGCPRNLLEGDTVFREIARLGKRNEKGKNKVEDQDSDYKISGI